MDKLKIMEQALTVKINAIKIQQISMSNEDYDILEILNEVHGIEEKMDGQGLRTTTASSEGDGEILSEEEGNNEKDCNDEALH